MWDEGAWTGLMWFRKRTGGGLLWMWYWTFGFHKMCGISWLTENWLASKEGLCSMQLVTIITLHILRNRVLLDRLFFAQLLKKFLILLGSWPLITVCTNFILVTILSLMIPVHTVPFLPHPFACYPPVYTLIFQDASSLQVFKQNFCIHVKTAFMSEVLRACNVPYQFHLPWLNHHDNWWIIQFTNLHWTTNYMHV